VKAGSHTSRLGSAVVLAIGVAAAGSVLAGSVLAGSRAQRTVATIGDRVITIGDVERQLETVPRYQLRHLGPNASTIRARFVDQLVRFELLALGGEADGLASAPDVRARIDSVLRSAMKSEFRTALRVEPVTESDIKAYYDAHSDRYRSEERIKIWQIVVQTQAQADAILHAVSNDPAYQKDPIKAWGDIAREASIDKATSMRRGNLGFVRPDGSTAHKHVKVDPTLYQAAAQIRDGEVFPAPVPLGSAYVVLQRRGSHRTPERKLVDEAKNIAGLLGMQRQRATIEAHIAQLRQKYVTMVEPEKLSNLTMSFDGELRPRRRPGTLSSRRNRK
jgi:peptidyl-prolyl cis-trans isomerase C